MIHVLVIQSDYDYSGGYIGLSHASLQISETFWNVFEVCDKNMFQWPFYFWFKIQLKKRYQKKVIIKKKKFINISMNFTWS